MMDSRSVKEWVGKTPDTQIPPRVKARVFARHDGVCHISGRKIMPGELWDCDHVIALVNGGENRESNIKPALRDKHKEKTKADVAEKAAIRKITARHLGIRSPKCKIQSRGFAKKERREKLPIPPQRAMFR
jgi:5-methylcytosine-specific restriction endonuclease McrA